MDKIITVVVPVYNIDRYLLQCIESIINQTYKNIEIILVNDGSTDCSGAICDNYAKNDPRVLVIHQKNQGLVGARKSGLSKATGDYVVFVDGDDWIEPEMLQSMLYLMEEKQVDIVETGYKMEFGYETKLVNSPSDFYDISQSGSRLIQSWMWDSKKLINNTIWSKLYKTEVIRQAYENVPNNMSLGEDILSFIYLFRYAKKIYVSDQAFYHYRYRANSMSHGKGMDLLRKNNLLFAMTTNLIKEISPQVDSYEVDKWYYNQYRTFSNYIEVPGESTSCIYRFKDFKTLFNKSIIIYGAGRVGFDYYKQLQLYKKINIVAWVDKSPGENEFCDIQPVSVLENLEYDYILIAIKAEETAEEIKASLVEKGIPAEKIIWQKPCDITEMLEPVVVNKNIVKIIGGLGNQMFQYAFYRALQNKTGDAAIYAGDFEKYIWAYKLPIFNNINIIQSTSDEYNAYYRGISSHKYYKEENDAEYDEIVFDKRDTSFEGYWQSEKYFKEISDEIRNAFKFTIANDSLKNFSKQLENIESPVSVHIRRGDYLKGSNKALYGDICTEDYYKKAMQIISSKVDNPTFIFFSDDMNWTRDTFQCENAIYVESSMFDEYDDWFDMYLMSCCKHNIIANSSFSWWGAWLNANPDKIVIAPKKWLNGRNTPDICPDEWIRL